VSLDCVIYCAFYNILFRGGRYYPDTMYIQSTSLRSTELFFLEIERKSPERLDTRLLIRDSGDGITTL